MARGAGKKPPSHRQLRVGEEVRHVLAEVFQRDEARIPGLDTVSITVSEVKISPDLRNATAYVTPLAGINAEEIIMTLNVHAPEARRATGKRLQLRYTPKLHFKLDRSFEEAARINDLLRTEQVQEDLQRAREEAEDISF